MHERTFCTELFSVLLLPILAAACTSVDTSVVGPTTSKCQVSLASAPVSFGPGGGAGAVNIATTRDCTWSITAAPAWVSIAGARGGQGEAVVSYSVASNPVPSPRSGSISVGAEAVQISQDAAPCFFELNRREESVSAAGGQVAVQVSTLTGCNWSVKNDVPWVVISSGQTGNSSGTVGLQISANAGTDRLATLTIAGQTFTLRQSGGVGQSPTPVAPLPVTPAPVTPAPVTPPPVTPPPVTSPPQATPVQVEGRTKSVKGKCPNLTFTVSGRDVETSGDTVFEGASCRDLEKGDLTVRVTGLAIGNGTIDATRVQKIGNGND